MTTRVLLAVFGVVALVWIGVATYESVICRYAGYERFVWYENGRPDWPPGGGNSGLFPAMNDVGRFADAGVKYDNYDRFRQCGGPARYAHLVNVVRFSVGPGFKFVPSEKYSYAKQVPMVWMHEPINEFVPANVKQAQVMYAGAPGYAWSWRSDGTSGLKSLIDSFEVEWIKEEPLDEAHLIGIWQTGWLFRSARLGYYIWIG